VYQAKQILGLGTQTRHFTVLMLGTRLGLSTFIRLHG